MDEADAVIIGLVRKIYTGGRITLTPSVDGGERSYDIAYFSRKNNTFTALKAGAATLTYTAGGISTTYDITIEQSELPSTGQDFSLVWMLGILAFLFGSGAVAGMFARKRIVAIRK